MDRRAFLKDGTLAAISVAAGNCLRHGLGGIRLMAAEAPAGEPNPNWVSLEFKPKGKASSFFGDPPGGYAPENVGGDNLFTGWEADQEAVGAWLQIDFPEARQVSELFILAPPLPRDIIGQDVYSMTYSRVALLEPPRKITITFSDHTSQKIELGRRGYFEIITLPKPVKTRLSVSPLIQFGQNRGERKPAWVRCGFTRTPTPVHLRSTSTNNLTCARGFRFSPPRSI